MNTQVTIFLSWTDMSRDITASFSSQIQFLKRKGIFKVFKNTKKLVGFEYTRQTLPLNMYTDFFKKLASDKTSQDYGYTLFQGSDGIIKGVLTQNNKPIPNVQVNIYQTSTGLLAARVFTDNEGNFIFYGLLPNIRYNIVASDPNGVYNTVAIDNIRIDSRKDYTQDVG